MSVMTTCNRPRVFILNDASTCRLRSVADGRRNFLRVEKSATKSHRATTIEVKNLDSNGKHTYVIRIVFTPVDVGGIRGCEFHYFIFLSATRFHYSFGSIFGRNFTGESHRDTSRVSVLFYFRSQRRFTPQSLT